MAMTLSSLGFRMKTNSLYNSIYFAPKHVARRSARVKAINDKFRAVAAKCKGTKKTTGNRTNYQLCVGKAMRGASA